MSGGEQGKTTSSSESKEADSVNKDRDEDRLIRNTTLVFLSPSYIISTSLIFH